MRNLICLDFDGVLCNCESLIDSCFDWEHLTQEDYATLANITDAPVEGAIEALRNYLTDSRILVAIFSCRNSQPGGITAMKNWLLVQGIPGDLVEQIEFPHEKPQAKIFIDDRNYQFLEYPTFPSVTDILKFEPWWKR